MRRYLILSISCSSYDYLNAFFTDPRHGRYCGRYFLGFVFASFVCYIARKTGLKFKGIERVVGIQEQGDVNVESSLFIFEKCKYFF